MTITAVNKSTVHADQLSFFLTLSTQEYRKASSPGGWGFWSNTSECFIPINLYLTCQCNDRTPAFYKHFEKVTCEQDT